jgi:hypothetical protein
MKNNRDMELKQFEIRIRCQDGQVISRRNGTKKKIRIRALDPLLSADIKKLRGTLVIIADWFQIRKSTQTVLQ